MGFLPAAGALPAAAYAGEKWPAGPIRLVVSYGAGGSLDAIARILSNALGPVLGQSVIVENVPGADGTMGVRKALTAPPDGTTFLVGITSDVALAPLTNAVANYSSADLAGVIKVGTSGIVLAGRPSLKAATLGELARLSQATEGGLTYGTPGVGSFQHLSMQAVSARAGIKALHVPYNAAAQIATDVMGGHLDLAVAGLPSLLPLIDTGKLKPFAVMSRTRDIGDMRIPAVAETPGMEGMDFDLWTGIFAPKNTAAATVEALNQAIARVLQDPAVVEQYRKVGVKVAPPMGPAQFTAFVRSDLARLQGIVAQEGLQRSGSGTGGVPRAVPAPALAGR